MTCQPVDCSNGFCDLADGYTTSTTTYEEAETDPEVEALKTEVEELKEQIAGGGSTICNPYDDPDIAAWRITDMALGTAGTEGMGYNLDGDETTCAPEGNEQAGIAACEQGIDNAIAGLAKIVNPILEENLPRKAIVYSPKCDALLFPEETEDADSLSPLDGDFSQALTGVKVTEESISGVTDESWTILIPLPFSDSSILRVEATDIRIDATWNKEKEAWVGLIGGWASKTALEVALADFTTDDLEGTSPETALSIVMQLADKDTDGDGENDSVSLGIMFEAATIDAGETE